MGHIHQLHLLKLRDDDIPFKLFHNENSCNILRRGGVSVIKVVFDDGLLKWAKVEKMSGFKS